MRMIPAVPFSVLNYAAGASAVRVLPYLLATLAGLLPGTAAVVILGDALTGNISPLLILVSLFTAASASPAWSTRSASTGATTLYRTPRNAADGDPGTP